MEAFKKIDFRIGRIVSANVFVGVRKPAYQLQIDFGSIGIKRSSAQLTFAYEEPSALVGQLVIAVVNFPPRQIAKFMSEVLVTGFYVDEKRVMLMQPIGEVELGQRVFCDEPLESESQAIGFDDFLACKIVLGLVKRHENGVVLDCGNHGMIASITPMESQVGKRLAVLLLENQLGYPLTVKGNDVYFTADPSVFPGTILA
jgi:tRNA-binding protein